MMKPLPADFLEALQTMASEESDVKIFLFGADEDRRRIVEMITKANDLVYADPQVEQGSQAWMRNEWSEVQKFRDGLIMDEYGQPPLKIAMLKLATPPLRGFAFRHNLLQTTSY